MINCIGASDLLYYSHPLRRMYRLGQVIYRIEQVIYCIIDPPQSNVLFWGK